MIDNRTVSAIDQALQKYDTPVGPLFVAKRHGRIKKCFSRSGAINRLVHFVVQGFSTNTRSQPTKRDTNVR